MHVGMRTALSLTLAYGLGLALGLAWPGLAGQRLLALSGLGVATAGAFAYQWAVPPRARRLAAMGMLVACTLLGMCLTPKPVHEALPPAGMARLEAFVEEVRHGRAGHASARIRVIRGQRLSDGAALPEGTHLTSVPFPLPEGARVSLLADVKPAMPFRNPSPHPPLRVAHPTRGLVKLPTPQAFETLEQAWHARVIDDLRRHVRQRLWLTLPEDAAAVASAILLGDPDGLSRREAEDVRAAGLSHVFAVSGMHVTLLAGLSVWLLTQALLRVPRIAAGYDVPRIAAGLGIPLALSIAALTGGAPSGWRASITTAVAWTVTACGRKPDIAAVTAVACLLYAVIVPADALRPAFLLSVAATSALLIPTPRSAEGFRGGLHALCLLTLRTTLATAPVVWWSFGSLPLVGLLANLLLVPVGSLLLLIAALHAWIACGASVLAPLTAPLVTVTARAFLRGSSACSALDPHLDLPVLSLMQGCALALGTWASLYVQRAQTRNRLLALALAGLCLGELHLRRTEQPQHQLRATFVDVGQGDSAIVDLPNGQVMLIDGGGNPQGGADPGERALVPLLAARRRAKIDVVVLTHPHPDHYGGLRAVLSKLEVRELWDSGQGEAEASLAHTSQQAAELVQLARSRGVRVLRPAELCGRPRNFGAAQVRVVSPCPAYDSNFDANDNSLVLRIEYAGRSLLMTGDIEGHTETQLVAAGASLKADVLKVAHHGSRTSSAEALLRAVSPEWAVVSRGAVNPFGHPHPEVMERLQQYARKVIDIAESGGTILSIDRTGQLNIQTAESRGPLFL